MGPLNVELHSAMSQPDVAKLQQAVDSRSGKPGSFYQMVVRHAIASEARDGVPLAAEEAVRQVAEEMGVFIQDEAAPTTPARTGLSPNIPKSAIPAANQQSQRPSTLPKASQTGTAPMKKGVTSTDDLRKLFKQRFASKAA